MIETVFNELKHLCQVEHACHRSVCNFAVNLMAGITAYGLADNTPLCSDQGQSIAASLMAYPELRSKYVFIYRKMPVLLTDVFVLRFLY